MDGLLVINKEKNCTSRDVVNNVSKLLGIKKVGHTGTLDPIATGVLVLCLGKCTKLVDVITSEYKEYIAGVCLGIETDTLDITGSILKYDNINVTREDIENVLSNMVGYYDQEVPIYSAVKINGKKLYEYARNSIEVNLPKRNVHIKSLELVSDVVYNDNKVSFQIKCLVSKGTYIRSLIRDISYNLGTVGVMTSLCRTKQGNFNIENSFTIENVKNKEFELINLRTYFNDLYTVKVDSNMRKDILNGKIINNIYKCDKVLFVDDHDLVLAIYTTYEKDISKMKPYKMLGGVK